MKGFFAINLMMMFSVTVLAGEVVGLTTFQAGTPAKAADVNGNFSAVKTAVDDNHQRLQVVEGAVSSKQSRVNGSCAVGKAIAKINEDGSVVCNDFAASTGVIAVSAADFDINGFSNQTDCIVMRGGTVTYVKGASTFNCGLHAQASLPHGATVTGIKCTINDISDKAEMTAALYRLSANTTSGSGELPAVVMTSPTTNNGIHRISSTAVEPTKAVIDNENNFYYVIVNLKITSPGTSMNDIVTGLELYGCSINYQL